MNTYIVYSLDACLSTASLHLENLFEYKDEAIEYIIDKIKKCSIEEKNDIVSAYSNDILEDEDDFDDAFQNALIDIKEELKTANQTKKLNVNYKIELTNL